MLNKWTRVVPSILQHGGLAVPGSLKEDDMYNTLNIMDKAFRSSGPTATAPGAFSIHEVTILLVTANVYIHTYSIVQKFNEQKFDKFHRKSIKIDLMNHSSFVNFSPCQIFTLYSMYIHIYNEHIIFCL